MTAAERKVSNIVYILCFKIMSECTYQWAKFTLLFTVVTHPIMPNVHQRHLHETILSSTTSSFQTSSHWLSGFLGKTILGTELRHERIYSLAPFQNSKNMKARMVEFISVWDHVLNWSCSAKPACMHAAALPAMTVVCGGGGRGGREGICDAGPGHTTNTKRVQIASDHDE